jgi:predicted metal-dependent hydrolase
MKVRVHKEKFERAIPAHWTAASALQSHVLNTLSLMFPDGERFFVRSVKYFSDRATDDKMRAEIKAFIGQETQHGAAHDRFNAAIRPALADMSWFMYLFTVPTFQGLEPWIHKLDLGMEFGRVGALSVTAAAENMTAGFANMVFEDKELQTAVREDIRDLFMWHAAEEIEHRELAFDLLRKVNDAYWVRMFGASVAYAIIFGYVVIGTAWFMLNDKNYPWSKLPADLVKIFTDKFGLGKLFVDGFIDYARPDFHQADAPAHPQAGEYLARLAAAS